MTQPRALPTSFLTARCIVRKVEPNDAAALFEAARTNGFSRWLSWEPPDDVRTIADKFRRQQKAWARGEAFSFTVLLRDDGTIVGGADLKPDRLEPHPKEFNLGYWTHPRHQGCGYAGEFVAGVVRWAFEDLGAQRLIAGVGLDNKASHRVLRRLGFSPFDRKSVCSPTKAFENIRYELRPETPGV